MIISTENYGKFIKFMKIADNKDKLLKILQYLIKLLLITSAKTSKDLKSFASTLSLARKLGRLGNWIPSIEDICTIFTVKKSEIGSLDLLKFTGTLSSFGNDILDDWIALQKGKLLMTRPYLASLDLWSTRLWFLSTSIDIHFTLLKVRQHLKIRKDPNEEHNLEKNKDLDLILTLAKQTCDWIFCFWELTDLGQSLNSHVPVIAGLSAAIIGAIRGWRKI